MSQLKTVGKYIFNISFIFLVFYFILHKNFEEIILSLSKLTFFQCMILVGCGLLFYLLDAIAQFQVISDYVHTKRTKIAIELVALNSFLNATTSSIGTIPLQSVFLKRHSIPYSVGITSMFLNMIFHKVAMLLNALLLLILQWNWILQNETIHMYIFLGFALNIGLIVSMALFVFSPYSEKLIHKWIHKDAWKQELLQISYEAKRQTHNRKYVQKVLLAHFIKVCWMCFIPVICFYILDCNALNLLQIYALSSLANIIASSLPNVAGMGPLEYAFIVLFSFYLPSADVSCSLLLYRISSYYLLFIISSFIFMQIKNQLIQK